MRRVKKVSQPLYQGRQFILMLILLIGIGIMLLRAVWIEVFDQDRLQSEADRRQMRVVTVPPYRGMVLDRHREPLAVSSPAVALVCDPRDLLKARQELKDKYDYEVNYGLPEKAHIAEGNYLTFEEGLTKLAGLLNITKESLLKRVNDVSTKRFMYLSRQLPPEAADAALALEVATVRSLPEYRRFYPMSEMTAHLVGFTNIDGQGVEGIEHSMDAKLAGQAGKKRVVRDGKGRLIENVEQLEGMVPGRDVPLTIDRRIQYAAYKALKEQVYAMKAKAGSAVVLDVRTNEILAMVNMPAFNPNNRSDLKPALYRNRAIMDAFEAGSTMKPLTVAAALDARVMGDNVEISTEPGYLKFGNFTIRDVINYGNISVSRILSRSSNVGSSKIALLMTPRQHWMFLSRLGFGQVVNAGFSNEGSGSLSHYKNWKDVDQASHGYGYGLSVTLLQLANAYTIFANNGVLRAPTIFPRKVLPAGQQIVSKKNADVVLKMMETVLDPGGTGIKARVDGYRVAGKTGTAYKYVNKRYDKKKYTVSFVGIAPVTDPRVVVAVMLDEPVIEKSGGRAAAPLFSTIMGHSLRVMDVPPDKYLQEQKQKQQQAKADNKGAKL